MTSDPGSQSVPPSPPPPPAPGAPPPAAAPGAPGPVAGLTSDERTWATISHLASLVSIVGTLVVWLIKKDESPYVAHHAREALNFQITMFGAFIVAIILAVVTCGIGGILLPILGLVDLVFSIIGAMKANEGLLWKYPVSIRLITTPSRSAS